MKRDAIFSDGTNEYCRPWQPARGEKVTLRLRTGAGDPVRVYLVTQHDRAEMRLDEREGAFDYYRFQVWMNDREFSYVYEVDGDDGVVYFDRYGLSAEIRWQYAFRVVPGFQTPDWTKGAVMYQIYVDRFCNGDPSNDVVDREYAYCGTYAKKISNWDQVPARFDVANFYGGDLEGVREKMYYLKSLGVEVIYFNPLFVSPSNHKYDIQDYEHIDPHFARIVRDGGDVLSGKDEDNTHATRYQRRVTDPENLEDSNRYFARFVQEAHVKGIRVILDGVFNHCGSFNKWMDRERIYEGQPGYVPGAYITEDSPYHDYFEFQKGGKWPYNKAYNGWWGHDTLPKLNYEGSKELEDEIISIGKKWVSPPFNCDGWRLDVAADLGHSEAFNHSFWQRFRREVKEANPDAVILAEHYGDARSWLSGDQWDSIMNYDAFMEPVTYFLTGMEKHSDAYQPEALGDGYRFEVTMRHTMSEFLTPSLYTAMNQLSNHDHSRFLTRTNHKVGRVADLGPKAAEEGVSIPVMKEAALMLLTWPGAPAIYYGDEAGVCGFTDPDSRRTYPWGRANYELIDFHRDMIFIHKENEALKTGAFIFLRCGSSFVSYGRFTRGQKIAVCVNSSAQPIDVDIPVWKAEVPMDTEMEYAIITNETGYSIMPMKARVTGGMVHLHMHPHEALVLKKNL